jgi:Retroviral aspartyl protease
LWSNKQFCVVSVYTRLNKPVKKLPCLFEVETAKGDLRIDSKVEGCTLTLEGYEFPLELYVAPIRSFDVIVGMDWLDSYDAVIVCREKAVRVRAPDGVRLVARGDKLNEGVKIVTMMKARKLVQQGCEAFLAYAIDERNETPRIEEVPVVNEFSGCVSGGPSRSTLRPRERVQD